jgi:hypothetical protein
MTARKPLTPVAIGAVGLLLAACASQPLEPEPSTAQAWSIMSQAEALLAGAETVEFESGPVTGDTLVCRDEARVGTHMTRQRCFTRSQLERITRDAQEWMRTDGRYGEVTTAR